MYSSPIVISEVSNVMKKNTRYIVKLCILYSKLPRTIFILILNITYYPIRTYSYIVLICIVQYTSSIIYYIR